MWQIWKYFQDGAYDTNCMVGLGRYDEPPMTLSQMWFSCTRFFDVCSSSGSLTVNRLLIFFTLSYNCYLNIISGTKMYSNLKILTKLMQKNELSARYLKQRESAGSGLKNSGKKDERSKREKKKSYGSKRRVRMRTSEVPKVAGQFWTLCDTQAPTCI